MPDISDYDKSSYDYTKYWDGRDYEDAAEQKALRVLLPKTGTRILDLGGGFGRLAPIYAPVYKEAVILDYSQIALHQAQERSEKAGFTNVTVVHGDAYATPFPDNSFDTIICIRVLHHIEDVPALIKEISRIISPGGVLVLEMANKIHLKAVVRAFLRGNFSYLKDETPLKYTTTTLDESGIFYNFHPKMVKRILTENGFVLDRTRSVSNMRLPQTIATYLPINIRMFLDSLITPLFSFASWGPSVWIECHRSE